MDIQSFKTPVISVGDCLEPILDNILPPLNNGEIVLITSKIISLSKGCIILKNQVPSKEHLVREQAEAYLPSRHKQIYKGGLTIKHHMLIPAAGIDESNAGEDYYILFPPDPFSEAESLCAYLKKRHRVQHLGVIITDSHTTPLRRGVTGIALAWWGLQPYNDKRGEKDLFGQPLKVTTINVVDALAAAAVFTMGEGAEQTPLALIRQAPGIEFIDSNISDNTKDFFISLNEDIYGALFDKKDWVWKPLK